jgi:hypothetical protein
VTYGRRSNHVCELLGFLYLPSAGDGEPMTEREIDDAAYRMLLWSADRQEAGDPLDLEGVNAEFFSSYPRASLEDALKVAERIMAALRRTAH